MKEKSFQNFGIASSEVPPKDASKDAEDGKTIPEPEFDAKMNDETTSPPVESSDPVDEETIDKLPVEFEHPVEEETATEKPIVAIDILSEPQGEGEDGWQSVQRPRSAGSYGRRLRQRRATVTKVYGYQKKDVGPESNNARPKSIYQNTKYYLLKKRTVSPGSYADYHPMKGPSPTTKFGRRIVKAVTYRVKSVSSSPKDADAPEVSMKEGEALRSPLELCSVSSPNEIGHRLQRSSIVSLGKSPSYKEVAVAPPGTIPMLQVREAQNDVSDNKELGVEKQGLDMDGLKGNTEVLIEPKSITDEKFENSVRNPVDESSDGVEVVNENGENVATVTEADNADNITGGKCENHVLNSKDGSSGRIVVVEKNEETKSSNAMLDKDSEIVCGNVEVVNSSCLEVNQVEVVEMKEETKSNKVQLDEDSENASTRTEVVYSSYVEVDQVVQKSIETNEVLNSVDAPRVELCDNDASSVTSKSDKILVSTLEGVEDFKERSSVSFSGDALESPNKKLSASAAPFNPSQAIARTAPVALNITLPSGPGAVGPWPLNMTFHPGSPTVLATVNPMCSSPHHPYPSPPPTTPNMIHSLPFLYPTYTQAQAVTTTTFPMSSGGSFHPSHFAWQRNMNPHEYMPSPVWPGFHRVEFSVAPTVVEPFADPILGPKEHIDTSESLTLAPNLPVDITDGAEIKKELDLPASEVVENVNEVAGIKSANEKEDNDLNPCFVSHGNQVNPVSSLSGNSGSSCYNQVARPPWQVDSEKTINILIRGKRNRKQTLRMPISLLKRPYSSQPFKVVHSRVVRENEALKFTSFSSNGSGTATAE